jgi:lipoprotein NlpI
MKRLFAAVLLAGLLAACSDATVAADRQLAMCQGDGFEEQRLAACTAVIAATSVDPRLRASALIERGIMRRQAGQHTRAVADFGRALRLDARNADAYIERGLVHQDRGAYDIALRDYEAALAVDPASSLAAYHRDAALRGRTDAFLVQLGQLDELLAREPANSAALNNRCWIRAILNDVLNAALVDCNAGLLLAPRDANLLDSRGLVHLKRNEFEAALADYEAALSIEPERGHFLYGRGIARLRLGHNEGAADLAAAERAEPGVAQAYRGYGVSP